jgi:hypothetical protein
LLQASGEDFKDLAKFLGFWPKFDLDMKVKVKYD